MSFSKPLNLRARFQELNSATSRDAAALAAEGKRATMWMLVFAPLTVFLRTYIVRKRWGKGVDGFIDALFDAYEVFVRHAKLWEIYNTTESKPPPRS
jgi:hypothetical protein